MIGSGARRAREAVRALVGNRDRARCRRGAGRAEAGRRRRTTSREGRCAPRRRRRLPRGSVTPIVRVLLGPDGSGDGDHPRPIADRRIAVERQPRQGRQHRLGRLRPDRHVHRRGARLAAARGDPRAHADHAAHLRRTAGARARLVLSLGQPPLRSARVAERGVVDRHGAADGRRPQRAAVLRRRSRDRAAGHGDLPPPRFRLDAQRPPDPALARLAARERDDRAPLGRLQRGVDALPARPRVADASAAGGLVASLGPADADLGRLDLRHPRRAALPASGTRTRGSISAPGAIPIRRTTGSPTASPRHGRTAATACRSAIGSRATRRTCGA